MEGPDSSYSCLDIHICWKVDREARIEPTIQRTSVIIIITRSTPSSVYPPHGSSHPSASPHVEGGRGKTGVTAESAKMARERDGLQPNDQPGDIQAKVDAAFKVNGGSTDPPENGQFSDQRFAFLFKPGEYSVDVPVGYYTQVLGLGQSPDDVVFTGDKGPHCEEANYFPGVGALDTFWRSAENFKTTSSHTWWNGATGMLWAVSQASPLRRIHVTNNLLLFQYIPGWDYAGFSSGGFAADIQVDGATQSGSQQQWFTRNSRLGGPWTDANWNMVFVGVEGAPATHCGRDVNAKIATEVAKQAVTAVQGGPITTVDTTPLVAEKPFISVDNNGLFTLNIPGLRANTTGTSWGSGEYFAAIDDKVVDFSMVYVTQPSDTAAVINKHLDMGLHVVLSPAIYNLSEPLRLNHEGQVLLGLGIATLVASKGNPCVLVGDVDGIRVAGILLQAGPEPTPTLLQWGVSGNYPGDEGNPGFMHDVFARVGGPDYQDVQTELMVDVRSGNVIGDNLWLWRADHSVRGKVYNMTNPCSTGLNVTGNDVTFYGLAVEHTLKDLVVWSGERGRCFFYQSEFPYDVDASYGEKYVSYRVSDSVEDHDAWGVGAYHYFRDHAVTVKSGFSVPESLVPRFRAPMTVFLSGQGTVSHIINENGDSTFSTTNQLAYFCPSIDGRNFA
eukprot:CAMPEP_0114505426 /NCGR_PEP_ID=MMETSP0109-20121206/10847_1 /TAXON_ID=29199 /ORGANISM="Chlorarachnion reptans, Strain CCCM449" /LENGTH=670 /DNA_ID=CAMNT_0001683865 /DNA_START=19 /DNA_END=2032 /DNA_ORIENTATION=+